MEHEAHLHTRLGSPDDLADMVALEAACFDAERRDSPAVTRASMANPRHEAWVTRGDDGALLGSMILRFHPHTCRIHSIATAPAARGRGVGRALLELAAARARARRCRRVHLEADARNPVLVNWYRNHGYTIIARLPDYYARRRHAVRMRLNLAPPPAAARP
jgi:ribosomal protein S18 acetylase RimI-like enzyme